MPELTRKVEVEFLTPQELANLPLAERNNLLLQMAEGGKFDFVDFGTHKGAGLRFGVSALGGSCGLGVELDDRKAILALKEGLFVYSGDVTKVPLEASFNYAVCRHVLEHLPNKYLVGTVVWKLSMLCKDYIYIEQPDFTTEAALYRRGVTLSHSTLEYHTCRLTIPDFEEIFSTLGIRRYAIGGSIEITSTGNAWVHRAGEALNRMKWEVGVDAEKPNFEFKPSIFRDFIIIAALNDSFDVEKKVRSIDGFHPFAIHY